MMDNLPEATAKECSQRFPIKETIDTILTVDYNLLSAYESEYTRLHMKIDSLLSEGCDTVFIDSIKTIIKQLPAKTNTKVIVKTQENTAKTQVIIDSCQKTSTIFQKKLDKEIENVAKLNEKCDKYKGQRDWLFWIVILLLIWTFRKQIASIFKLF